MEYALKSLILVVGLLIFLFVESKLIESSIYNNILQGFFIVLFITDIIFHLIIIIKDFEFYKLLIVVVNILIKASIIIMYFSFRYTIIYSEGGILASYFNVFLIGMAAYPIILVIYFIKIYRKTVVSLKKPNLLLILNGIILYVLQFPIRLTFSGDEGYEYLDAFNIVHGVFIAYLPFVVFSFLYVSFLFKKE